MPDTLEVEVLAIDGAPPQPAPPAPKASPWAGGVPDWRQWGARLMKLDRRWWPLWVVLGLVLLTVVVAIALCAVTFIVITSAVRGVVRMLLGGPSHGGTSGAALRRQG